MIGQRKPGRNAPSGSSRGSIPFSSKKILSVSMQKLISTQLMGQGLVTGHCSWWSSDQDSALSLPPLDLNL